VRWNIITCNDTRNDGVYPPPHFSPDVENATLSTRILLGYAWLTCTLKLER
jgi:hypothetical protein